MDVSTRSVFGSRGRSFYRHRERRLGIQTLEDDQSAARFYAAKTLRIAHTKSRRRKIPDHAGERNFHTWRGERATENDRTGKESGRTGKNDSGGGCRSWRARMERFAHAETRTRAGGNSSESVGVARERSGSQFGRILSGGRTFERAQNYRTLFDIP